MIIKPRFNTKRIRLKFENNIFVSASDISLYILTIFIIIPYLNIDKGIPFFLPPSSGAPNSVGYFPRVNLYMDSNNKLYVNLKPVTLDSLSIEIDSQIKYKNRTIISFYVEDSVRYQKYIDVIAHLSRLNKYKISISD